MSNEETVQQRTLRLHQQHKASELWQVIHGSKNKIRIKYMQLDAHQKSLLLRSSGIVVGEYINTKPLDEADLPLLYKGLERMRNIIVMFDSCKEDDFKPKTHNQQVA